MKNNIFEYKGYHTRIEFDAETLVVRGKIEGINDFVDFQCEDLKDVENEFHKAVDDYLEFCELVGKEPEKEYKGSFNVRIDPMLHKKLATFASKNGDSLNTTVEKAIKTYISDTSKTESEWKESIKILSEVLATQRIYSKDNSLERSMGSKIIPLEAYKIGNIRMSYKEM